MNKELNGYVDTKTESKIRFAFAGDLCLGSEFINHAKKNKIDYLHPFRNLDGVFTGIDIGVANLEGPICRSGDKRQGVSVHLFNDPAVIELCLRYKLKVLCLGNNHIMDYGTQGLKETQEAITSSGLLGVGAGMDVQSAQRPLIVKCKNIKVGFLAFTTGESNVNALLADNSHAGCAPFSNIDDVCKQVEEVKASTDVLCVALHWGHEYFDYPSVEQVGIAHALADAGANYIIGHHPHVIQGIERYRDSLIVYSLGNFFFPPVRTDSGRLHYQKKRCREFMILVSEIDEYGKINFEIIGGVVPRDYTMRLYSSREIMSFQEKIRKLSQPFFHDYYERWWLEYRAEREKELVKESLYEAVVKASRLSLREWVSNASPTDLKRNVSRLLHVLFR